MSYVDCQACDDIKEYAPEFVEDGVNDDICASLANNTGLNPNLTVLHNNCEDLKDVNDCLIGRMNVQLSKLDYWKDFMRKFVPNVYETIKALICDSCGQWNKLNVLNNIVTSLIGRVSTLEGNTHRNTNDINTLKGQMSTAQGDITTLKSNMTTAQGDITSLKGRMTTAEGDIDALELAVSTASQEIGRIKTRIESMCELLNQNMDYQLESYGTLMGTYYDDYPARAGGTVGTKNGVALVTEPSPRSVYGNLGFRYRRIDSYNCSGEAYTYEWLIPQISFLTLGDVENGDILYTVSAAYAHEHWGFSDNMRDYLAQFPQYWDGMGNRYGYDGETDFTVQVGVDNGNYYIKFIGSQGLVKNQYVQKVPVNGAKCFTNNPILH